MIDTLRVASWNSANAFGDHERLKGAIELFKSLDADTVYVPETAKPEGFEERVATMQDRLSADGYTLLKACGYYRGPRPYGHREHVMSIWSRIEGAEADTFRAGKRNAIESSQAGIEIIAIHQEDHNSSDRAKTAADVLSKLPNNQIPQIIMGDFNDMDPNDERAALLRMVRPGTELFRRNQADSLEYYGKKDTISEKLVRVSSLGIRLSDMSAGRSLSAYHLAGFENADELLLPTVGVGRSGKPRYKIDHILGRDVHFSNHRAHETDLSDHSPVSVTVRGA